MYHPSEEPVIGDIPNPEDDTLEIFRTPLQIVARSQWGAEKPFTLDLVGLPLPLTFVLLMYTKTPPCTTDEECAYHLRDRQRVHMEQRNLADIQWNFMIGGNGKVYEGRGWNTNATKDPENLIWNYKSIDVAYIGRGLGDVTADMKASASRLVRLAIQKMVIRSCCYGVLDDMQYRPDKYIGYDHSQRICRSLEAQTYVRKLLDSKPA